jgi:hypothetical protein
LLKHLGQEKKLALVVPPQQFEESGLVEPFVGVDHLMASQAQGHQVGGGVRATLGPVHHVVDVQVVGPLAATAPVTVPKPDVGFERRVWPVSGNDLSAGPEHLDATRMDPTESNRAHLVFRSVVVAALTPDFVHTKARPFFAKYRRNDIGR